MLVLSRKLGERITIGTDIEVSVVHIGGGRVQLGVQAPRDIAVLRQELADRITPQPACVMVNPSITGAVK